VDLSGKQPRLLKNLDDIYEFGGGGWLRTCDHGAWSGRRSPSSLTVGRAIPECGLTSVEAARGQA
jgi:hypothetical protein